MTPLYCHLGQIVSDTTERNDEIPSSKVVKETETTDPQVFCSEDTLKGHAILVTPRSSEREGKRKSTNLYQRLVYTNFFRSTYPVRVQQRHGRKRNDQSSPIL